jgi:RNA polymerase sigma-70 factor, ECF subfamily
MSTATDQASNLPQMNREQRLIEQAQAGDHQAFEDLVFKYDRHILGLTLRLLGSRDEAKDAYQETFLRVFHSLGQFRRQSSFYTWIFRIATNVCFDRLRQRKKVRQEVSIRLGERISRALNSLSTEERLVFELKHYQGMKLKQIGEMTGNTEDSLRDCLYRATRKLRAELPA